MRLSVLLATVLVAFANIASTAPLCTSLGNSDHVATMADYVAQSSVGCIIGDKLFSNFLYIGTAFGTGVVAPDTQVYLTPVGADTYNPGIVFSSNGWVVPGAAPGVNSYVDATIGFTVTVLNGGHLIEDASMTLSSFATAGTARANIGETVTPGGAQGSLNLAVDSAGALVSHQYFTPTDTVTVLKDLILAAPPSAFGSGSAQITSFAENFSEIPEPVGAVLIGSGLLALGIWRRRVSRRG
jgi:hypothetical protein